MQNVSLKVLEKSLKFLFKKGYKPWGNNLLRIIRLFVGLYQINCFNLAIELYKPYQSYVGQ